MSVYRYTVIFEPAEEGGYVVHVPALNGAATQGETLEEVLEDTQGAITSHLEALAEDGQPVPQEPVMIATVRASEPVGG